MTTQNFFPQAGFLRRLELLVESPSGTAHASLPPALAHLLLDSDGSGAATSAAAHLIQMLKARKAMLQAALDTELAADELRRYQKFSKPGPPSPHAVFLRQKQAAARNARNQSKQSFIKAAAAFVRGAGIKVSPRVSLEVFAIKWIDANVPAEFAAST